MSETLPPAALPARQGFGITIAPPADPDDAWRLAEAAIAARTGAPAEAVRSFLDSRYGRDFARGVADALAGKPDVGEAIGQVADRWMDRRIDERLEQELGIPQGLPYLTGLVLMHQALSEIGSRF